jgi:Ca2+:H+ antiporter
MATSLEGHVRRRLTGEEIVLAALLVFIPVAVLAGRAGLPSWIRFFFSVIAVVPLAGFIGAATEALADRIGARAGGLLNATFGNAPDLLIGIFGVQKGLIPLVKATLVGALISNSALVMGLCYLAAGLRYRRPTFRRDEAGHHSVLMLLALAAVLFPTLGAQVACPGHRCTDPAASSAILTVSVGIAVALLLAYVAYVAFGILGIESIRRPEGDGADARVLAERSRSRPRWPLWLSLVILVGSTALLIPVTDVLTSTVTDVTRVLGWTDVFVGIVIVANAGNVAEGYAALRLSVQRRGRAAARGEETGLDLALGIASASSIQIATFIAPVVVLFSLTQRPMNLVFSAVEVGILALLTLLFSYIAHDGESNWLEGFQLIVLYAMAAVVFFALPANVFGG